MTLFKIEVREGKCDFWCKDLMQGVENIDLLVRCKHVWKDTNMVCWRATPLLQYYYLSTNGLSTRWTTVSSYCVSQNKEENLCCGSGGSASVDSSIGTPTRVRPNARQREPTLFVDDKSVALYARRAVHPWPDDKTETSLSFLVRGVCAPSPASTRVPAARNTSDAYGTSETLNCLSRPLARRDWAGFDWCPWGSRCMWWRPCATPRGRDARTARCPATCLGSTCRRWWGWWVMSRGSRPSRGQAGTQTYTSQEQTWLTLARSRRGIPHWYLLQ